MVVDKMKGEEQPIRVDTDASRPGRVQGCRLGPSLSLSTTTTTTKAILELAYGALPKMYLLRRKLRKGYLLGADYGWHVALDFKQYSVVILAVQLAFTSDKRKSLR